jgi:hypothetical protein
MKIKKKKVEDVPVKKKLKVKRRGGILCHSCWAFGNEHFARVRTVASGSYYSLWLCPKCFPKWERKFEKVADDLFNGIWKTRD